MKNRVSPNGVEVVSKDEINGNWSILGVGFKGEG